MNRIINDFFEREERGQPASKLHINKQPTAIGQAAAKWQSKKGGEGKGMVWRVHAFPHN